MKHGTLRRKTKKQKAGIWRSYKDRLFCRLFSEPENALSLVNAVCGTSYTDAADLRIVTLEDAIYLSRKNDLAVCFGNQLVLFEQQSTDNPNMPLRGLLYFAREYEGMLKEMELNPFSERLVRLPAPQYYVLYNGEKALPEQMEYRLSQAFDRPAEGYEWTAKVININAGCQSELMRRCPSLRGYAELIARIRAGQQNGLEFGAAVDEAVDSCIADGFLAEFLKKHKGR